LGEADWEVAARCVDLNKVLLSGAMGLVAPTMGDAAFGRASWSSAIAAQMIGIMIKKSFPYKPYTPFGCEADCDRIRNKLKDKLPNYIRHVLENMGA
jgi:hypothetical protein